MPWNTTPTPEQRLTFVTLARNGRFSISELCEQFAISRKGGHKWLVRFAVGGAKAWGDGSRAPHSMPLRTAEAVERLIVSERRRHPTWGTKNLRVVLEGKPAIKAPRAFSTLGESALSSSDKPRNRREVKNDTKPCRMATYVRVLSSPCHASCAITFSAAFC